MMTWYFLFVCLFVETFGMVEKKGGWWETFFFFQSSEWYSAVQILLRWVRGERNAGGEKAVQETVLIGLCAMTWTNPCPHDVRAIVGPPEIRLLLLLGQPPGRR